MESRGIAKRRGPESMISPGSLSILHIPFFLQPPVVNMCAFTVLSVNSPLATVFPLSFFHSFLLTLLYSLLVYS